MNKREFIDKLLIKFMSKADANTASLIASDMESYLSDDYDFSKMYEIVSTQWSKSTMPPIAWLKENGRYKEREMPSQILWSIWAKWGEYEYEFACRMSETLPDAINTLQRRGLVYARNNRDEIKATYGI